MRNLESKNIYLLYLVMVALSVLLILAYELIPARTMRLAPHSQFSTYTDGDSAIGGNSEAHFIDEGMTQWHCTLRKGVEAPEFPSCRIGISFSMDPSDWTKGLDMSSYNELRLRLDYKGPASFFRAHFRNFDSRLSNENDYNSAKFIKLIIRNPGPNSDYRFSLTEFKLADWWIQQFSVPNDLAKASFENVTSFELDFAEPAPYGEHFIVLKNIELVGHHISAENWYLSILILWMSTITINGLLRLKQLNTIRKTQATQIQEMHKFTQDLKEQSRSYKNLSRYDPLTGAMNRLGLQEIIDSAFQWRSESSKIALLVADLDHFKRINDNKGHDVGDEVLKCVAKVFVESTRAVDSVARWGGEEFIFMCPNTGREPAMVLAEKIRKEVIKLEIPEHNVRGLSVSIGITVIKFNEGFDHAFSRADKALYEAKNSGRNCWIFK